MSSSTRRTAHFQDVYVNGAASDGRHGAAAVRSSARTLPNASALSSGRGKNRALPRKISGLGVRNLLFELPVLTARSSNAITSEIVLDYVRNYKFDELLGVLSRIPEENKQDVLGVATPEGLTCFHYAVQLEETSYSNPILEALVECSPEASTTLSEDENRSTALHMAVQRGDINRSLLLINLALGTGSINVEDSTGRTPLHYACESGLVSLVLRMIEKGAKYAPSKSGEYALHLAAAERRVDVFRALKDDEEFNRRYRTDRSFPKLSDSNENTLLHIAIDVEEVDIMEFCLQFKFDLMAKNIDGLMSLHVAARRGNKAASIRLLQAAKDEGLDIQKFLNCRKNSGGTPLYLAAKFNRLSLMKYLIKQGAEVDISNNSNFSPLLASIRYLNPACAKYLISEAKADILIRDNQKCFSALLWALAVQNLECVKIILDHASKDPDLQRKLWRERDSNDNTPHHIAARCNNIALLETLVHYNTTSLEERNKDGCTPFHIAVKKGKILIVNFIISNSAESLQLKDRQKNGGLHLAAMRGHSDIVKHLVSVLDFGLSINWRNSDGHTPIHLAAMNGHDNVLKFLVEQKSEAMEILDNKYQSALYLACSNGHNKCVEVLLQLGAEPSYAYTTTSGVEETKSCLMVAINNDHSDVVTTIIKSDSWIQALQYCEQSDTPMRQMIRKMPTAAKLVFQRCVLTKRFPHWKGGYVKEIEYNYEFLEDFQDLYEDEGPKVAKNRSNDAKKITRTESVVGDEDQQLHLFETSTAVSNSAAAKTIQSPPSAKPKAGPLLDHVTPLHQAQATSMADPLPEYAPWGPEKYHFQNHPLHLMVYHGRHELLKHPLVASFIHYKWNRFGRYAYYPNIVSYAFLMILLTVYMFLRFEYSKLYVQTTGQTLTNCTSGIDLQEHLFGNNSSNTSVMDPGVDLEGVLRSLHREKLVLIVCAVIITLNCLVRIGMEIGQIVHHRGEYFTSYINYMEGFLYIATIVFVTGNRFRLDCLPGWQWELGAACIFLSWINFILFLSQQPMVGIYVVMFQDIIKTFVKMAPMSILLILAFGQPFFMLLRTVYIDEDFPQPFITFPYSLLKTMIMTVGEFETDPIFFSDPSDSVLSYPTVTYILWVLFLIIMPVLLQNLLVGLAVDDIKTVQEKAALKKEALQIEFILDVLSRMPKWLVRWINKDRRKYRRRWGKGPFDKFRKWLSGSSWKPEVKEKSLEYTTFLRLEQLTETMADMGKKLESLSSQNTKLEKMITHFTHEQERLVERGRQEILSSQRLVRHHSQPLLSHQSTLATDTSSVFEFPM